MTEKEILKFKNTRFLFVINSLGDFGGAEKQAIILANYIKANVSKHVSFLAFGEGKTIRKLFTTYTKILSNYTFKGKLVLCNIYIPFSKRGSFHEKCIKKWNEQLYMFSKENNYNLMRFDKVLFEQNDFVDNLEPSRIGGRKIVGEMLNYVD
mgnify:CR=1 FL=1